MEQWPDGRQGKKNIDMHGPSYPACSTYDIDEVEKSFINTPLYQRIMEKGVGRLKNIARPSMMDGELFGTYCSKYNELVKTKGFDINQGRVEKPQSVLN